MSNMDGVLTQYVDLRKKIEAAEEMLKRDKQELETVVEALLARFDGEGVSSVKVPDLGNFIVTERTYASILAERKEDGIRLMKQHYPDLVQETVNSSTLGAFVAEAKKNQVEIPAELAACINAAVKRGIQWRR